MSPELRPEAPPPAPPPRDLAEEATILRHICRTDGEKLVLLKAKQVFSSDYYKRSDGIKELAKMMKKHRVSAGDLEEGLRRLNPEAARNLTPSRVKELRSHLKVGTFEKVKEKLAETGSSVSTKAQGAAREARNYITPKVASAATVVKEKLVETGSTVSTKAQEAARDARDYIAPKVASATTAVTEKLGEAKEQITPKIAEALGTVQEKAIVSKDVVVRKVQTIWSDLKELIEQHNSIKEQIQKAGRALNELRNVHGILKEQLKQELQAAKSHKIVQDIIEKVKNRSRLSPENYALALIDCVRAKRLTDEEIHQLIRILDKQLGNDPTRKTEAIIHFVFYLNHPDSMPKSVRSRIASALKETLGLTSKQQARLNETQASFALIHHPIAHELLADFSAIINERIAQDERRIAAGSGVPRNIAMDDLKAEIDRMLRSQERFRGQYVEREEESAEQPPAPPSRRPSDDTGRGSTPAPAAPPARPSLLGSLPVRPAEAPSVRASRKRTRTEFEHPAAEEDPAVRKARHSESGMAEILKNEQRALEISGFAIDRLDLILDRLPLDRESQQFLTGVRDNYNQLKQYQEWIVSQLQAAHAKPNTHDRALAILALYNSPEFEHYNDLIGDLMCVQTKLSQAINNAMKLRKPDNQTVFAELENMRLRQGRLDNDAVFLRPLQRVTAMGPTLHELGKNLPLNKDEYSDVKTLMDTVVAKFKTYNARNDAKAVEFDSREYLARFRAQYPKAKPEEYARAIIGILRERSFSEDVLSDFLTDIEKKIGRAQTERAMRSVLESLDSEAKRLKPAELEARRRLLANPLLKVLLDQWASTMLAYRQFEDRKDLVALYDRIRAAAR